MIGMALETRMIARHRQAPNPATSPLDWMPLDFVLGGTQALLSGLRDPSLHVRSQVWCGGRGVRAKPEAWPFVTVLSLAVTLAVYMVFILWFSPWL